MPTACWPTRRPINKQVRVAPVGVRRVLVRPMARMVAVAPSGVPRISQKAAAVFEDFIQKKYVGSKSFSLEGCEALIPLLDEAIASFRSRERLVQIRNLRRSRRVQTVPALGIEAVAAQLVEARAAPDISGDAKILFEQVRRGHYLAQDGTRT